MSKNRFLGGVWPVVQRELREGARRPFNHWLRVAAATAGLLVVLYIALDSADLDEPQKGSRLFTDLHILLMGLICLAVPWMTADCIAREKREGTLGLLFLTPLTVGGIVAGKGFAQALRALTMWISVAPMLTIPFLMGGIGWADATSALALEFAALVISLAIGLLASTLVKSRGAASVLALLLAAGLAFILGRQAFFWCMGQLGLYSGPPISFLIILDRPTWLPAASVAIWHETLWASPILALFLLVLVLRLAAWRVAKSWQDKIPSPRQENLLRKYCTPVFEHWFARRTRRTLDRNPIAWLQQYSWKARLGKWVLCLVFVVLATATVTGDYNLGELIEPLFFLTIAGGMTFAGINSFAQEKRSGALELILITPISVNQIIFGRVLGVWKQFLPAALILAIFDAGMLWIGGDLKFFLPFDEWFSRLADGYLPDRLMVVCGFITLPVFALYFALRIKNLIVAAGMTWAALLLPLLFALLFARAHWLQNQYMGSSEWDVMQDIWIYVDICLANLTLALVACFLLRHSLSRRIYSF